MDDKKREPGVPVEPDRVDVRSLIKQALDEFTRTQQAKVEPAYKVELEEERKRRSTACSLRTRSSPSGDENRCANRFCGFRYSSTGILRRIFRQVVTTPCSAS